MIRVNKSLPPNTLTEFSQQTPNASWEAFRDSNGGEDYKALQTIIFSDQHQLCAYCEVNTGNIVNNRRIEHFVSKSFNIIYHTDWNNIFGVCIGGTDHENKTLFELPSNLSCDSHKSHVENTDKTVTKNWHGTILNPLTIPLKHKLFCLEKASGKLLPNAEYCALTPIPNNIHTSTLVLVEKTINILNLNCLRLCTARRRILFEYDRQVKIAREKNSKEALEQFANYWLTGHSKEFQTTRNILLSENAYISKKFNL